MNPISEEKVGIPISEAPRGFYATGTFDPHILDGMIMDVLELAEIRSLGLSGEPELLALMKWRQNVHLEGNALRDANPPMFPGHTFKEKVYRTEVDFVPQGIDAVSITKQQTIDSITVVERSLALFGTAHIGIGHTSIKEQVSLIPVTVTFTQNEVDQDLQFELRTQTF